MNIKSLSIAFAALFALCAVKANAQDLIIYQSHETGVAIAIPNNASVINDNESVLHLATDDVVFSSNPLETANLTSEAMIEGMTKTAAAIGLDISKMDQAKFETKTLNGVLYNGTAPTGENLIVGVAEIKDNENYVFLFTITYKPTMSDVVNTMLANFEFNADQIQ